MRLEGCYPDIDIVPNSRCVSICSGGLDSTIAMMRMIKAGVNPIMLHVPHGSLAEFAERRAVEKIASRLDVQLLVVNFPFLGKLGGSPLTNSDLELPRSRYSVETTTCWVPARNVIFMAIAASICDKEKIPYITMGINASESNYPDHTSSFINNWNSMIRFGALNPPLLVAPNFFWQKRDEVIWGTEYNAPLDITWSCDRSGDKPCGVCGCCWSRQRAFARADISDPQEYQYEVDLELDTPVATERIEKFIYGGRR